MKRFHRIWIGFVALALAAAVCVACLGKAAPLFSTVAFADRELPLAAHWNLGELESGFSPEYQMKMIAQGHHLLPWFRMPNIEWSADDPQWTRYFEAPLRRASTLRLPVSLVSSQWEAILTTDAAYFNLPAERNPNVIGDDGKPRRELSPFGPTELWREVGRKWGSSPMLRKLETFYPNPPQLLFVSNNEPSRLWWVKAEEDAHYLKLYGRGRSDDFKRKVVGDGWIECYRALQTGIREGLSNPAWRDRVIFVGYDAFGPPHFARWPGWMEYSLYSKGRIDPKPLAWDGGSPSYYVFNWNESTDYTVFGPQIESMNWIFMLREAERLNPKFWFEISTWDGHEPEMENDKRKLYAKLGQRFSPERYGGMVQFGMWLLRPRVVREFRGWRDTLADAEPFFLPIMEAVDRVHSNPLLGQFWKSAELVVNSARQHPYQTLVPAEYQAEKRWFLLDTDLDAPRPWKLTTAIPVFSMALVKGNAPSRQWLVYGHAPLGSRNGVSISIPDYGAIRVDVAVAGSFYVVDEASRRVQPVK
ncbi:MAG: hypothetical protein ABI882_07640 [Acidobacteriota bacterium]